MGVSQLIGIDILDPFLGAAYPQPVRLDNAYNTSRIFVFDAAPGGPPDRLDEPMTLSIADKAALVEAVDSRNEHVQWELRKALDKIHSHAGHPEPLGTRLNEGRRNVMEDPFDGMDADSSAMLMDLAQSVMPTQPIVASGAKYTPEQRRAAINRWLDKRSRRHLTSQTKYKKMKDVAVGKSRCKGGKFISKAERARLEAEAAASPPLLTAMEPHVDAEVGVAFRLAPMAT